MRKVNPYLHLLIRMSLVLAVVATAAFVYNTDANAKADATDPAAVVQAPDVSDATAYKDAYAVSGTVIYADATDPGNAGADVTDKNGTDPADSSAADRPSGIQTADAEDPAEPGTGDETSITDIPEDADIKGDGDDEFDSANTQEPSDGTGDDGENGGSGQEDGQTPEQEAASQPALRKNTQEYVDSLLVTHPDHYDAKVVENARSIPVDSDNDRYLFITGKDKEIYKVGHMPDGFKNDAQTRKHMVTIDVPVWKMNRSGEKYSSYWSITINAKLADSIRCIFSDIYQLDIKFPFNYLSGYSYRKVGGVGLVKSKLMSTHAFGVALDINMGDNDNDYFLGKGNDLRNKKNPYCIPDEVIAIFEDYGWFWGGNYEICADTMHFQYFELGFLQYESDEPFPILYRGAEKMDPVVVRNLTQRLVRLGYLDKETQSFSKKVDKAVKQFQEDHGLEPDGIVNYRTWEPLINLTHDMAFVF